MSDPDFDLEVGEAVTMETISQLAETGPLYRGINHRHINSETQIGILFMGIDSEYHDNSSSPQDLHDDTFLYQSPDTGDHARSQGNAFLKDAIDSDIPIFLFVQKPHQSEKQVYYGKVTVEDYWYEAPREVIVFEMRLLQQPSVSGLSTLTILSASAL